VPDGTVILTSPSGRTYATTPGSALLFPSLRLSTGGVSAPEADPPLEYCGDRAAAVLITPAMSASGVSIRTCIRLVTRSGSTRFSAASTNYERLRREFAALEYELASPFARPW